MPIITQTYKQLSDIYVNITSSWISGSHVYVRGKMSSYYSSNASMSLFEYSIDNGSTYSNGTVVGIQVETVYVTQSFIVPLKGKEKYVDVVWNAGADLTGLKTYDQVVVRENWHISGGVSPAESSSVTSSAYVVSFTSSNNIPMDKPYPIDDNFTASFQTLVSPVPHRNHFVVFWDTSSLFPSASQASSGDSQTNWFVSESAFPAAGVLTATSSLGTLEVEFKGLGGLTNNETYYLYVSRSSFAV